MLKNLPHALDSNGIPLDTSSAKHLLEVCNDRHCSADADAVFFRYDARVAFCTDGATLARFRPVNDRVLDRTAEVEGLMARSSCFDTGMVLICALFEDCNV